MLPLSPSAVDADELFAILDDSTAPTTPEGSLSFSPALRPQDDTAYLQGQSSRINGLPLSLSSALLNTTLQTPRVVRNICCVGAGFVGGPTAAVIAFHNPHIRVTVVDRDENRIRRWNSKHPPIHEPGLNDILRIARDGSRECVVEGAPAQCDDQDTTSEAATASSECTSQCEGHSEGLICVAAREPNLVFTTDVAKCVGEADVVLIAVNTPTKSRGNGAGSATDMAAFEAVTAVVAQHARPGAIIVEKSTVPCRTAQLVQDTLALYRPGVHFEVLSNPEFLAAGTAVQDLLHADRILIGSSNTPSGHRAAASLASVYASWIPQSRIIPTNVFSSELAKLVANAMLAQRISSINSIAAICDATGADVDEVAGAIGADPRIGSKFLKAGIGFGGSCFKKDVLSLVYLAQTLVLPEVAAYWRAVIDMNEFARNRFVSRVVKGLNNTLAGKKVTVLGYAFKKDTNDTRESPALDIIRALEEEGPREIAVFDPLCIPSQMADEIGRFAGPAALQSNGGPIAVYADVYAACQGSDAVLITTEFDEFKNTPMPREKHHSRPPMPTRGPATTPARLADPRPFDRVEPHEGDLLALQSYLRQSPGGANPTATAVAAVAAATNPTTTTVTTAAAAADPTPPATAPAAAANPAAAPVTTPAAAATPTPTAASTPAAAPAASLEDPLNRLLPLPACPPSCPDCALEHATGTAGYGAGSSREHVPKRRVDWRKIYYHMNRPHWVFDGRGVLDVGGMEKIGFRVESVGRRGGGGGGR